MIDFAYGNWVPHGSRLLELKTSLTAAQKHQVTDISLHRANVGQGLKSRSPESWSLVLPKALPLLICHQPIQLGPSTQATPQPLLCVLTSGQRTWKYPSFKIYYEATVLKTVWYWQCGKYINQWNRPESLKLNSRQLVFNKAAKRIIQWGKESSF